MWWARVGGTARRRALLFPAGAATMNRFEIHKGDCRDVLPTLEAGAFRCCVTSPPYWGLRDYGSDLQIGLEPTPAEYVEKLVGVFREVRRVLRSDGTLWLNLGDCYATGAGRVGDHPGGGEQGARWRGDVNRARDSRRAMKADRFGWQSPVGPATQPNQMPIPGLKPKDLVGIPWRVAFALQADGWFLRSDIVWQKPNAMPESMTDRPTRSHEYVFLLSKSRRYYYDADAIAEPCESGPSDVRKMVESRERIGGKTLFDREPLHKANAGTNIGRKRAVGGKPSGNKARKLGDERGRPGDHRAGSIPWEGGELTRNARSVWEIATVPFKGAHFATMPPELARRCIAAGSAAGDAVLDPFAGMATTGLVANRLGRDFVGVDLNGEYVDGGRNRIVDDAPLFNANERGAEDGTETEVAER